MKCAIGIKAGFAFFGDFGTGDGAFTLQLDDQGVLAHMVDAGALVGGILSAIFSVLLPKKMSHTALLTALAEIESVRSIEEL